MSLTLSSVEPTLYSPTAPTVFTCSPPVLQWWLWLPNLFYPLSTLHSAISILGWQMDDLHLLTSCNFTSSPTLLIISLELLHYITHVINCSLETGHNPTIFKPAVVTPLLKKAMLVITDAKNYRPVSPLSFLSKVLEHAISWRRVTDPNILQKLYFSCQQVASCSQNI